MSESVRGIGVAVITSTSGFSFPFPAEECALGDAKSVLFIDHNKAEIGKLNPLLNEGVRTDHNIRRTAANIFQNIVTQFFLLSADKKADMDWQISLKNS